MAWHVDGGIYVLLCTCCDTRGEGHVHWVSAAYRLWGGLVLLFTYRLQHIMFPRELMLILLTLDSVVTHTGVTGLNVYVPEVMKYILEDIYVGSQYSAQNIHISL